MFHLVKEMLFSGHAAVSGSVWQKLYTVKKIVKSGWKIVFKNRSNLHSVLSLIRTTSKDVSYE